MPGRRIGRTELRDRLAVYFVADPEQTERDFLTMIDDALAGGVTSLQLRAKRMQGRQMYDLAVVLRERCRSTGALFFVNDRVDVAVAATRTEFTSVYTISRCKPPDIWLAAT